MTSFNAVALRISTDLLSMRSNPSVWNLENSRLTVSSRNPR